jgi:hypothetical protein
MPSRSMPSFGENPGRRFVLPARIDVGVAGRSNGGDRCAQRGLIVPPMKASEGDSSASMLRSAESGSAWNPLHRPGTSFRRTGRQVPFRVEEDYGGQAAARWGGGSTAYRSGSSPGRLLTDWSDFSMAAKRCSEVACARTAWLDRRALGAARTGPHISGVGCDPAGAFKGNSTDCAMLPRHRTLPGLT